MLEIHHISKRYVTGDLTQQALDDVSLNFRDNEFVSILGPSGSGKTTLLNIIGGLDRYDSGDLVINGVSTKDYKDADWDAYRNHTIGFVFQSYNLVAHQSALANVELALTISGVPRAQRKQLAMDALRKVGLAGQEHKKPNQMSGGQMQRVAIARALVNNPDIVLADEPTGALDTETGIQIMDLLREVAKDRLVIMVTHNPELAERYSTRIVRVADGHVLSDSRPFDPTTEKTTTKVPVSATKSGLISAASESSSSQAKSDNKRVKMSWATSIALSFSNLKTKLGRTVLTSFAGSIGIIGIAAILALSSGVNAYITTIQRDTMSSYPITINSTTIDMNAVMDSGMMTGGMGGSDTSTVKKDDVDLSKAHIDYADIKQTATLADSVKSNNLTDFKRYLDEPDNEIRQHLGDNGIVYSYDVPFSVLATDSDGKTINTDANAGALTGGTMGAASSMLSNGMGGGSASGGAANGAGDMNAMNWSADSALAQAQTQQFGAGGESMAQTPAKPTAPNFSQLTPGADGKGISKATLDSYDMLSGSWPKSADDVVLVLDRNNSLSAGTMYQLGLITADQYKDAAKAIEDGGDAPAMDWDYGDLVGREFTLTTASDRYKDDGDGTFTYLADGDANWDALRTNGRTLKISGVIRPMEDAKGANIVTAVAYTPELTDWMIDRADDSAIVKAQESKPDTDVLTGQVFADGRTADDNLAAFGKVNTDAPSSISIYTDSFDDKEAVSDAIKAYNDGKDEDHRITYTDYVALMTSSITTIVNVISYVLIAFVAVSLVVSCIMIGIITRISVLERTKEIGILRALGASKRNVSQVFNAETIIVGLASGLLGVGVTALLTIPANMVVSNLLGAGTLSVGLPIPYAIVLVAISVLITLIGGFLPARKAAKQDPVIALRTE